MKKIDEGAVVIWREPDPAHVPGGGEPTWIERRAIVCRHGRDESGVYTEIELLDEPGAKVVRVHRDSLREDTSPCLHPEHRLGTHGRLRSNQRVCMTCGDVVLVRRR
ncbi:MAG TPA: hypothetical protein VLE97_11270 [Gaiellaceae bacterium]|nr:hypothetical protein [Gaiellaceae bacterium]